jgi:hypothetical protein
MKAGASPPKGTIALAENTVRRSRTSEVNFRNMRAPDWLKVLPRPKRPGRSAAGIPGADETFQKNFVRLETIAADGPCAKAAGPHHAVSQRD